MSAAKWRISSSARSALTSFVSIARGSARTIPESIGRVAEAVDRLLDITPEDAVLPEDRALLSSFLASTRWVIPEAISELLDCVRAASSSSVDTDGLPSVVIPPVELPGDDCPRCGLERCGSSAPCSACGHHSTGDLDDTRVVREARDAARARLGWLVGPTLHLASLSIAREEVLARAGTDAEIPGDSHRLDVIDAQLEVALRGPGSRRFQEALIALSTVVDLAKSWPRDPEVDG